MGYTNKSYSELLGLIQALAGVDSFAPNEQSKILALVNRRLRQAYTASPTWPRYIVGAQARPANNGLIKFDYDNIAGVRNGNGASRSGDTVTITSATAFDVVAGMEVTISGLSGTVDPNGTYTVASISTTTVENDTLTYQLDTTNTASETYNGVPTVTPSAIPDIAAPDGFMRIWDGNPFSRAGANDLNFYVDSEGAHISGDHSGLQGYWVAFKKEWPGPYTSTATDIPLEFFYYTAHSAYADFLRGDGQVDKALAEETAAQTFLMLELDNAASSRNNNRIFSRVQTYVSHQSRF